MGADRPAWLAFLLGVLGGALFVLADPRRRLVKRSAAGEPRPWWQDALRATFPSTVGLAVLTGVALAVNAVLAAALAGIIGGLGVSGMVVFAGRLTS